MTTYTPAPISPLPRGRPRLAAVLQASGAFIGVSDVASALGVDRMKASKVLARWNAQGWIKRVRRGVYVPVPLDTRTTEQVLEDPWMLVPRLFGEGYIGGWSAAEHWGLTEQLFRSICVVTTLPVRAKQEVIQGVPFVLRHINARLLFGTKSVWRGSLKVQVSTPARTIVDMLDDPSLGGGIRHVAECLATWLSLPATNPDELIDLGDRLGNGAVFKRLGFLVEENPRGAGLVEACRKRLTSGLAKLDPSLRSPRVVTRWRLRIPENWQGKKQRRAGA